jgi:iron complex outermembrane receptor protein
MRMKRIQVFTLYLLLALPLIAQEKDVLTADDLMSMSLEDLKNVKIVSASRYQEPIYEAPVPVTIITEEMIKMSGATNFEEVLLLYVPGLTDVADVDDPNISMRGVYGTNQQKILFMLNGHRLNLRILNSAFPEYINSLEKIKRIEILRGPASSMYGNVALTSVINIITKAGGDINGIELKAGGGNHGQMNVSFLLGEEPNDDSDIVFWGSYYHAKGELLQVAKEEDFSLNPKAGEAYIGGVKDWPAFDVGGIYHTGSFEFMANYRGSSTMLPFSSTGLGGEVYNYDDYRTFHGYGPGTGIKSLHIDAKYNNQVGKLNTIFNFYFDQNSLVSNHVSDPHTQQMGIIEFDDLAYGSIIQLNRKYKTGKASGTITGGIQLEQMRVFEGMSLHGVGGGNFTSADSKEMPLVKKGNEESFSGFVQLKHKYSKNIIFNIGTRYDYKIRREQKDIAAISPRLAVIYNPKPMYSLKIGYSRSFVDAAYFYRYNNTNDFQGTTDLKPEYMQSLQLSQIVGILEEKLNWRANVFYTNLTDVIYRDENAVASSGDPQYINAGELSVMGIENELSMYLNVLTIHGNFTYQGSLSAKDYGTQGFQIYDIPGAFGAVTADLRPFTQRFMNLHLLATGKFIGEQLSPIDTYLNGSVYQDFNHKVDAAFIFNAGIRFDKWNNMDFLAYVSNVFNKRYYQGGTTPHPYPQKGRWINISLTYKIPFSDNQQSNR